MCVVCFLGVWFFSFIVMNWHLLMSCARHSFVLSLHYITIYSVIMPQTIHSNDIGVWLFMAVVLQNCAAVGFCLSCDHQMPRYKTRVCIDMLCSLYRIGLPVILASSAPSSSVWELQFSSCSTFLPVIMLLFFLCLKKKRCVHVCVHMHTWGTLNALSVNTLWFFALFPWNRVSHWALSCFGIQQVPAILSPFSHSLWL